LGLKVKRTRKLEKVAPCAGGLKPEFEIRDRSKAATEKNEGKREWGDGCLELSDSKAISLFQTVKHGSKKKEARGEYYRTLLNGSAGKRGEKEERWVCANKRGGEL